jgi:FtsP/CotA-like multicopper oxidase with cupredoxin domain
MATRRELLKLAALGAGGAMLTRGANRFGHVSTLFASGQRSPFLAPFVDPLPTLQDLTQVPPLANLTPYAQAFRGATTRHFEIAVEERVVKFHRDLPATPVWAYVDANAAPASDRLFTFLIPSIRLGQPAGGGILIRLHNRLTTAPRDFGFPTLTLHFHGGHQPAAADGFPHDIANRPAGFPARVTVPPGGSFDYAFPFRDVGFIDGPITADERPSTLWFHDHILDFTRANVYRGLANIAPVFDEIDSGDETDPNPVALRLPSGTHDLPLVLQDKLFDAGGALLFDPFNQDGFLGDTMVVNGVVQPFQAVSRRKYRLRFLNGGNARIYQLYLTNDAGQTFPMTQIATDGGLLAHPIRNTQTFTLAMAERVEVVIDFADPMFAGQGVLYIENRLEQTDGRKPDGLTSTGTRLLKFILGAREADPSRLPDTLRPFAAIGRAELDAAERREFVFDRSGGVFTINNEPVDIEKALAIVKPNRPQIWRLTNSSGGWWHPIHVHLELMRVLTRNGQRPPANEADGMARKDTILLRDGETVDAFFKFRDFTGPFNFHCHNLEHEDMAMMARFDVTR